VQVSQGNAGAPEQRAEFFVGVFLALVDAFQVAGQLGGGPSPRIAGADSGQQRPGLGRGQVLGAAGDELERQLMQLGDHPGVVFRQRPDVWSILIRVVM
jgi:hypothetical protein